ncbi:MAG: RagB/SusD family nutrient uptake outer membrane protein [Bacteroidota bacterium]
MKNIFFLALVPVILILSNCSFDEQFDPNAPNIESVTQDVAKGDLDLLVVGIEAGMRNGFGTYVTATGTIARELYLFDADPRNTEDLLGKEGAVLDNNTFYLTAPFSTRYRVVKNCNLLLEALENIDAITEEEKQGYRGFANTIKGFMISQVLAMLGDNGVRIDVADLNNLGPYVPPAQAYPQLLQLMDDAAAQLNGSTISFALSSGFEGFDDAPGLILFNRALAARIATQGGLYAEAFDYVNASFLDLNGDLDVGPKHIFSTNPGDQLNPVFRRPGDNGDQIVVNPRIINEIRSGDARFSKFRLRPNPSTQDNLGGDYEGGLYETNVTPMDIIRNEELILILAEALIQTGGNTPDILQALEAVRIPNGLGVYTGITDFDSLIDELLYNRTYSLWGEGQQMFDLRRYGRLNDTFLPIDRDGDQIFTQFPIPLTEGQ